MKNKINLKGKSCSKTKRQNNKPLELVIATGNKKKLKEIKYMLKGFNFRITSLSDYKNLPRIIEDGQSFKMNAIKKAVTISRYLKKLTIGEDSGLEVKILGNRPGIYSSRYAGKAATDEKNNKKLLKELKDVPMNKRQARYVCAVALADDKGLIGVVEGTCSGFIATEKKGKAGFGYDPIFYIPKFKKTFGQLGERIKHRMSHRFKAFRKLREILTAY